MTGQNIKEIRRSVGLNQTDLGAEINASQAQISAWEKGLYKIPKWAAANIARLFLNAAEQVVVDEAQLSSKVLSDTEQRQNSLRIVFERVINYAPLLELLERQLYFLDLAMATLESKDRLPSTLQKEISRAKQRKKKTRSGENPGSISGARPPG